MLLVGGGGREIGGWRDYHYIYTAMGKMGGETDTKSVRRVARIDVG